MPEQLEHPHECGENENGNKSLFYNGQPFYSKSINGKEP